MKRTGFQPRAKPMSRCAISPGTAKLTIKKRTCKNRACRNKFTPTEKHPFAIACCTGCEIILAKQHLAKAQEARAKKEKKELKARKEAIKPRAKWLAETQVAVNAVVRERDRLDGCISCDKSATWNGQWHASHYLSVGAHPAIRFDLTNIHKACSVCNNYLSGNIRAYRPRLIAKIGVDAVLRLEGPHEARKYTVDDLKAIKADCKAKLKVLQANEGVAT